MAKTHSESKSQAQLVEEIQELRKQVAELQRPGESHPSRETTLEAGAGDKGTWFFNSVQDVIEGQHAEEGVQKSERYLRILLDSIPSGVVVIDAETHVIVDANSVALELIGARREQVIGSVCHNYICPAERCPITDLGQTVDHAERVLLTAEGTSVPIIKSVTTVVLDGREHLIESFIDITDRQRIEKALRESEEKHRAVLENIEEGYYEVDLAGNLTFFNDALCDILGYPADELIGVNNRQYMDAENGKKVFQTFNTVYETGEPAIALDWEIIRPDGSSALVEASVSLMRDATEKPIGFRGIVRNITEQRHIQAEREAILSILEHRNTQLQTAAEVSRAVSSILDPEALIPQVVDLVRERFDLYYAGLFLVDQNGEWTDEPYKWAVLRAGTGEAGRQMLRQGHKLEIGGSSMIGWCIANKQARIALDVGEDAVRFDNPSLPKTRSELALPLINRGRPIGALTIQSDREAAFSRDDVTVLQTMADQLANAIANARLYNQAHREINERRRAEEEAQRRAAQAGLVYEVGRRASGKLEQDALLSEIVTAVRDAFDYYGVSLVLLDEESGRLHLQAIAGDQTDTFPQDFSLAVGEGMIGQAAATGKSQITGDVDKDPNYVRRGDEKTRSELAVPIKGGQTVIGVLDLRSDRFNAFDETDALVMETLADQVAVALENAQLYQAMEQELGERMRIEEALRAAHEELARYTDNLERRTAQLQVGAEVAREAAAILDVQQLLDTAVRLVSERFGFYHAGVFLVDEGHGGKGEYAVMRAASSEGGRRMLERGHKLQVGKVGIVGYVAATGEPRIAGDVGQDAVHFAHSDLPDTRSEMGLPLTVRGRTIGVLDVQSTLRAAFSEDDVAVLQTLADQLAVAIDNARLVQRTETQLRELSLLYGEYSASIQAELASSEGAVGYVYDRIDVVPTERLSAPALDRALAEGETVALVEPDTAERMLATPLKLHDQVIGTLGIQETDGGRGWSPNEIALVEAVSEQVALALENAQHFAETQRSATQMQVLNELGQALAASLSVNEVLEESYRGASRLLDASNFFIALYDAEKNQISIPLNISESAIDSQAVALPADQGISGHIIQNRTSVLIKENVPEWQKERGIKSVGDPAHSWLGVPILIGDRVLGVMAAQSYTTAHAYDERDRGLLTAIASQTAIALQNAYLFEETQRRVQELGTLFNASEHLSSAPLQAEEIAEIVVHQFVEVINVSEASLSLVDEEGMMHVLANYYTENGDSLTMNGADSFRLANYPTTSRVMETLQPTVIQASDLDADPAEISYMEEHGTLTLVIIPLAVKGQAIGVIELETFDEERHFTQEQLNLAVTLANQSAVALDNAHLFEEAQRRATQFAAAAEVARDATSILDVNQLLDETVHLISDQFEFYHAGVFLLDEGRSGEGEYAVLRAASSEGGRRMLERGHRLPVGRVGIVGNVAATGQPRIALDVGEDAWHFVNPDLPNTRSEMGLPLKVREQVIGVLDVQSTEVAAFSDEDVSVLQTLADQLAGAIANARLFHEVRTEATRRALINEVQEAAAKSLDPDELLHRAGEVISRRLKRASALFSWEPTDKSLRPIAVHDEDGEDVILTQETRVTRSMNPLLFSDIVDERHTSVVDLRVSHYDQSTTTLADQIGIQTGVFVPLTVRDQLLGVLALARADGHAPEGDPGSGYDFIEIIGTNLSVALENARLYQEAVETAEQLQEMDRLKSQFLANMSHELRTPLNSIIGFSRVILKGIDGPLTDMQRTDLEAVYSSGQHLLGLINDILDISKIQAGKMEITIEDTDLNDIVKGVMSTAIALVKDKPIELQQSVPPDLPIIQADARRIRGVLLNIVGNATKFTDEGFIRVEIETTPTEVIIAIVDSGVGIPEDEHETIFEEFTQVDGSSTRAVGGTGLGLAISRRFVEMHGGRIWVESTPNVGSTFYVALPIAGPPESMEEPEEEETEEEATSQPEPQERTGERIVLCVDDDEGVITLFRRYLSKQGYDIVGLTEGTHVLEKAQELKPFAITLDVMMPDKDGWQIIQELKSDPDTRHIPVIMCSIVADKDRGISLGASGYLVKPILEDDLVAALEQLDHTEKHHRVLVVDDHAEDRSLLRRMIESQEGYEVLEAAGGQEAIDLISSVRPNIIILDLMMPDVDGFAVLESIKANTDTRHIPIIVVTAKDLTQQERDTLNKRVEALLQKGIFEQQELLADVAAALERIQ
jgi:PAS domain S-box-containing protein